MTSLLSSLKEEVRHLMSQAENTLEKKVLTDGSKIAPLIDRLEEVICHGLHKGVHMWDWIVTLERHEHNPEYEWAFKRIQMMKNESYPSERVLGRRWVRSSLNDQTLTASLALLREVDDAHILAYYQKTSIVASIPLFQQLLDILMPIGGCSLADRTANDTKVMADPYFIFDLPLIDPSEHTLPTDLPWQQDPVPTIETTRTVVVNNTSFDNGKSTKRRVTPKTSPKHGCSVVDSKDENDIKKRKSRKKVPTSTSVESATSLGSFDSLPPNGEVGFDNGVTANPSVIEKEKIRKELEEWRRQRAQERKNKQSPDSPQQSTEENSISANTSPRDEKANEGFNLSTHVLKKTQDRLTLMNKNCFVKHLLSVNSSLETEITQLNQDKEDLINRLHAAYRLLDSKTAGPAADAAKSRFTLIHTESSLRVSLSSRGNLLALTRSGTPCAFRLEEGKLIEDSCNQYVIPGPYQGSDRTLSLTDDKSLANTEWVFLHNRLEEAITGTCAHLYGDRPTGQQQQLLILRKDKDDKQLVFTREYLGIHAAVCGSVGDDDLSDFLMDRPTANSSTSASPIAGSTGKLDPTLLLSSLTSSDILARQNQSQSQQGSFNKLPSTPPPSSKQHPGSGSTSRNSSFSVPAPSTAFEGDDDHQKHRIKLITDVKKKHSDYGEKERRIERQGKKCKGCLQVLKKTWSPIYFTWRYDTVRFCWYMGKYYCNGCHDDSLQIVVPARVLFMWDVKPRPVCRDAYDYLMSLWDKPIVCVSAINPILFEQVEPMRQARDLRIQLSVINKTISSCDDFKKYLSDHPALVPEGMSYAVQGTELYSFLDLLTFHESQPSLTEAPTSSCKLVKSLETMRNKMIEHIVQNCDRCYQQAAMECETCATEGIQQAKIFEFEVQKVQTCRKCGRVYHRVCYQIGQCRHCA
eukprot:TRINITY_DN1038_c0_g1_i1.p1 TRINITY_DN1038_c0_g1~~TRINITY_DN1038_c0_g1_i1.p1  ORF type:complete len:919 (+),score=121.96 TRINITY_DN1038_c0_g1_i1:34-2790(+)